MSAHATPAPPALRWNIFCRVIDNHGDLGVCWRLSCGLAARGQRVRLWVDDASALAWMAPAGCVGVEVRAWTEPLPDGSLLVPGDVLLEAFGCEVPPTFVAAFAAWHGARAGHAGQTRWINLEYLAAEGYVERSHGLASPVMHGPGRGLAKRFFYPGFSARTGGLLREADLLDRQARFDANAWLQTLGLERRAEEQLVSLFCYEPPALPALLQQWASAATLTQLLVTPGRAWAAVQAALAQLDAKQGDWNQGHTLRVTALPYLSQRDFDHLLWACDLNFVRGEDSLVRALWAGQPLVWQIYPQQDAAHPAKLDAFLALLQAPTTLRQLHYAWNGVDQSAPGAMPLTEWRLAVKKLRDALCQQDDLVTQLLHTVRAQRSVSPFAQGPHVKPSTDRHP